MPNPDDLLVVQFRFLAMANDEKSIKEGRPIFDDVEVCEIRKPGSRDVKYFPSTSFSHWESDPMTGRQAQVSYAERFSRQYMQFKSKAAQTVTGTPLEFAQFLTDGRRAELRAQNVYTIETLAAIDGLELKNLGPGGREMKNKAAQYIEDSKSGAVDRQLQQEVAVLKARNQVLEDDVKALRDKAPDKVIGAEFEDMTDQQLRDYVVTHTGRELHGALPRKTLVRMAADATTKAA